MSRVKSAEFILCIGFALVIAGCPQDKDAKPAVTQVAPGEMTSAPQMPADWKVVKDVSFSASDIQPIAVKLGGKIKALRNTDYSVNKKQVRINTILAADETSAKNIMTALRKMKSDEAIVQKGLVIYEFVGKNEVLPEIRAGRSFLSR